MGPQRNIFALAMYISCCLSHFFLRWVPNANAILSGIWALIPGLPDPIIACLCTIHLTPFSPAFLDLGPLLMADLRKAGVIDDTLQDALDVSIPRLRKHGSQ